MLNPSLNYDLRSIACDSTNAKNLAEQLMPSDAIPITDFILSNMVQYTDATH